MSRRCSESANEVMKSFCALSEQGTASRADNVQQFDTAVPQLSRKKQVNNSRQYDETKVLEQAEDPAAY